MTTMMERLAAARKLPVDLAPRYPTGIQALDNIFTSMGRSGLQVGVYVLGGDAGAGKSTFCCQVMRHMAEAGHAAVYLAYEGKDNVIGIIQRLRLPEVISVFGAEDEGWAPSVELLCAAMELYRAENPDGPPMVICIDSIKKLDSGSVSARRDAIVRLHKTAHATQTIIFVIAHATKASEGKENKQLEGPSELSGDADTVLYLINTSPKNAKVKQIRLQIQKSRFCPTGTHDGFIMRESGYDWPMPNAPAEEECDNRSDSECVDDFFGAFGA